MSKLNNNWVKNQLGYKSMNKKLLFLLICTQEGASILVM